MVSIRELNDKLIEEFEKLSKGLPITRGGTDPRPLKPIKGRKRDGKLQTTPYIPRSEEEVRWRPTPSFKPEVAPILIPSIPTTPTPTPEVPPMIPIIEEVINNPAIQISEDMLPAINDPGVFMRNGELFGQFTRSKLLRTKKKRKVSKYQKEFGKQLKLLKKKHPRIPVTRLMKRAHAATRKALKK